MNTDRELRDMAYKTATGSFLTKSFSYKEYQRINIDNWKWEPFENWNMIELEFEVTGLADSLFLQYKKIRNDERGV